MPGSASGPEHEKEAFVNCPVSTVSDNVLAVLATGQALFRPDHRPQSVILFHQVCPTAAAADPGGESER